MASMTDRHRLASERHLGYEQGEVFDRRLREREAAGRAERLSRLVTGADAPGLDLAAGPVRDADDARDARDEGNAGSYRPALGTRNLESEVERLRAFYHAVQNSRAWRLTQRLRGVVGRAW
jgi:hypothetical protein